MPSDFDASFGFGPSGLYWRVDVLCKLGFVGSLCSLDVARIMLIVCYA